MANNAFSGKQNSMKHGNILHFFAISREVFADFLARFRKSYYLCTRKTKKIGA
jgi:hypothetical protein